MKQSEFWFPSMSVAEISDSLNRWGLAISESQIHRPTSDAVKFVYAACLQKVTGITLENLENYVQRALIDEPYPELYAQALLNNLFLFHLQRLADAARAPGFCGKDLTFPEPEKTRLNLSAIINFLKFVEEREPFVTRLQEQAQLALEERDRVKQRLEERQQRIAQLRAQRSAEEPRCAALKEDNAQLTARLVAKKTVQVEMAGDIDSLKRQKATLSRQKQKLVEEMTQMTVTVNSTKSRIVQSPDRIKRHIVDMGDMIQDEKLDIASNENKARVLRAKLDALHAFEEDISMCIKDLRDIQEEHALLVATQRNLSEKKAMFEGQHVLRGQLDQQVERAKRQLQNAEERLIRAQQHAEARQLKSQEQIERLKKEYAEMAEERRDNDRQVEEIKYQADGIERKMAEHLKTNEMELNELLAEYWNLRHQAEVYRETLASKLGIEIS